MHSSESLTRTADCSNLRELRPPSERPREAVCNNSASGRTVGVFLMFVNLGLTIFSLVLDDPDHDDSLEVKDTHSGIQIIHLRNL